MDEFDFSTVEVDDLLKFDDGRVACVLGIIEQEDQRVLQLSDGSDLRVKRNGVIDAAPERFPTETTKQGQLESE